jgi:hypothetical protein
MHIITVGRGAGRSSRPDALKFALFTRTWHWPRLSRGDSRATKNCASGNLRITILRVEVDSRQSFSKAGPGENPLCNSVEVCPGCRCHDFATPTKVTQLCSRPIETDKRRVKRRVTAGLINGRNGKQAVNWLLICFNSAWSAAVRINR